MVFAAADPWYMMLFKFAVLILAVGLGVNLIRLSLWNLVQRFGLIKQTARIKNLPGVIGQSCVLVYNLVFVWIMLQAIVVLVAGYLGVSAITLLSWSLHWYAAAGVVLLMLIIITRRF